MPPWHDEALTVLHAHGFTKGEMEEQITDRTVTMGYIVNQYQLKDSGRDTAALLRSVKWDDPEHLPFFTLLLHRWQHQFGYDINTARKLPLTADCLQILAALWWGAEACAALSGGLLAAGLLAASPLMIFFSCEIREYSLYAFPTVLASAAMMRAWRINSFFAWLVYTVTIAAGLNCSVLFGGTVIAHGVFALLSSLKTMRLSREGFALPSRLAAWSLTFIVAVLLFLPAFANSFLANLKQVPVIMSWICIPAYPGQLLNAMLFNPGVIFYWLRNLNPSLQNTMLGFLFPLILCWMGVVFRQKRETFYFLISFFVPLIILFWLPDLILGGQRSLYFKYYLSVPLAVLMFGTVAMHSFLTSPVSGRRQVGLLSLLFIAACELSSDSTSITLQDREIISAQSLSEVAKALVSEKHPLIVSAETPESTNSIQLLALSHTLLPDTQLLWLSKPSLPALPEQLNHFYLFNPPPALVNSIDKRVFKVSPVRKMPYLLLAVRK